MANKENPTFEQPDFYETKVVDKPTLFITIPEIRHGSSANIVKDMSDPSYPKPHPLVPEPKYKKEFEARSKQRTIQDDDSGVLSSGEIAAYNIKNTAMYNMRQQINNGLSLINSSKTPYAQSGQISPGQDINFLSNAINKNVINILNGLVTVSAQDLMNLSDPKEIANSAKNLGSTLKTKGLQMAAGLGLSVANTTADFVDMLVTGNNTWSWLQPAERTIKQGDDPQRSLTDYIGIQGDSAAWVKNKVLGVVGDVLGLNGSEVNNPFFPKTDLNGDGFVSEREVEESSKPGGNKDKLFAHYNVYTHDKKYEDNPLNELKTLNHDQVFDDKSKLFSPLRKIIKSIKLTGKTDDGDYNIVHDEKRKNIWNDPLKDSLTLSQQMGFDELVENDASFTSREQAPSDDEAYVPLVFTDLRPIKNGGQRIIYFRPIISSLSEDFAPEWNKQSYYGRSDQVATYVGTVRTISITFALHAFSRRDVDVIYKKLNWLQSMVYPQYDTEMLLKAGPVCSLRVGDVIASRTKQGLPGVIDSLSYDYSDSIWELDKDSKAPRTVTVAVTFTVLHDSVVGRDNDGYFGGIGSVDSNGLYTPTQDVDYSAVRIVGDIGKKNAGKVVEQANTAPTTGQNSRNR